MSLFVQLIRLFATLLGFTQALFEPTLITMLIANIAVDFRGPGFQPNGRDF
jgi:hypothetical protein